MFVLHADPFDNRLGDVTLHNKDHAANSIRSEPGYSVNSPVSLLGPYNAKRYRDGRQCPPVLPLGQALRSPQLPSHALCTAPPANRSISPPCHACHFPQMEGPIHPIIILLINKWSVLEDSRGEVRRPHQLEIVFDMLSGIRREFDENDTTIERVCPP